MILTWKSIDKSITNQYLLKRLFVHIVNPKKNEKKKEAYLSPSKKDKRIPPSNDTEKGRAQVIEHVLLYALSETEWKDNNINIKLEKLNVTPGIFIPASV